MADKVRVPESLVVEQEIHAATRAGEGGPAVSPHRRTESRGAPADFVRRDDVGPGEDRQDLLLELGEQRLRPGVVLHLDLDAERDVTGIRVGPGLYELQAQHEG